eukprot:IDg5499t1
MAAIQIVSPPRDSRHVQYPAAHLYSKVDCGRLAIFDKQSLLHKRAPEAVGLSRQLLPAAGVKTYSQIQTARSESRSLCPQHRPALSSKARQRRAALSAPLATAVALRVHALGKSSFPEVVALHHCQLYVSSHVTFNAL